MATNSTAKPEKELAQSTSAVQLERSKDDVWWHRVIETGLLHRWQCYKNRPRGHTLILRAFFIVCSVSLVLILGAAGNIAIWSRGLSSFANGLFESVSGLQLHLGGLFLAAVATVYWQMGTLFNRQWQHCNDLYTEYLKAFPTPCVRDLLANALAHDLLVCDMWALRSFENLFRTELTKAIEHILKDSLDELIKVKRSMVSGQLSEDGASKYLSQYEDFLLRQV